MKNLLKLNIALGTLFLSALISTSVFAQDDANSNLEQLKAQREARQAQIRELREEQRQANLELRRQRQETMTDEERQVLREQRRQRIANMSEEQRRFVQRQRQNRQEFRQNQGLRPFRGAGR